MDTMYPLTWCLQKGTESLLQRRGIRPKIKAQWHVCPDIRGKTQRVSNGLTTSSQSPLVLPGRRSPSQRTSLIMGTSHSACLPLTIGFQFPTSSQKYSNKPITSSHVTQGSPRPLATTDCPPQPLLVHSLPEKDSCEALPGQQCPPPQAVSKRY